MLHRQKERPRKSLRIANCPVQEKGVSHDGRVLGKSAIGIGAAVIWAATDLMISIEGKVAVGSVAQI